MFLNMLGEGKSIGSMLPETRKEQPTFITRGLLTYPVTYVDTWYEQESKLKQYRKNCLLLRKLYLGE